MAKKGLVNVDRLNKLKNKKTTPQQSKDEATKTVEPAKRQEVKVAEKKTPQKKRTIQIDDDVYQKLSNLSNMDFSPLKGTAISTLAQNAIETFMAGDPKIQKFFENYEKIMDIIESSEENN